MDDVEQRIVQLKEMIGATRMQNTEKSLEYCQELKKIAEDLKDSSLLGYVYFHIGMSYYILSKSEEMFCNIAKALEYLNESKQWNLVARSYNLMAIMSVARGNVSVGMDYYLSGIHYCRQHKLDDVIGSFYVNLGVLYQENGLHKEALNYFEQALALYGSSPDHYTPRKTMIYTNLAVCYMHSGSLDRTRMYIEKLDIECMPHYEDEDYVYVDCLKVEFYYICGEVRLMNQFIEEIRSRIQSDMTIMEIFEDLYHLCSILLDVGRLDVLPEIITRLETAAKNAEIANIQRKLSSLKMKYYKKKNMTIEAAREGIRFYELTEVMEKESQSMISNMLYVRNCLERENERHKQLELREQELRIKSETDPLTKLANRYRLNDYSEELLEDCVKRQTPMAFEILDVDYFKEFNDNYGHLTGDECICKVAELIQNMENDRIFCARYGGDEFIILYHDMSLEEVRAKAARLRQDVLNLKIPHEFSKNSDFVTLSQGICYDIPQEENKNWDFLHAADMMLYQIKRKGRNDFAVGNLSVEEIGPGFCQ